MAGTGAAIEIVIVDRKGLVVARTPFRKA